MNRRLKLGLGGLGFLGLNGAFLPNLEKSFNSFSYLGNFIGGGLRAKRGATKNDFEFQLGKNNQDTNKAQLEFQNSLTRLPEAKLDISDSQAAQSSWSDLIFQALNNDPSISSIKDIRKEIEKEGQVIKLQETTDQKYKELLNQHWEMPSEEEKKRILSDFQVAKNLVKRWVSRGRKSISVHPTALSHQQREGLRKVYSLNGYLYNESQDLTSQLDEISAGSSASGSTIPGRKPLRKDVAKALRTMGWHHTKFPIPDKKRKWDETNPFTTFFDKQEEFTKQISTMEKQQQQLARQVSRNRTESGMWDGWVRARTSLQQHARVLQTAKEESSGDIQLHIGSKLLEWMGQLNN